MNVSLELFEVFRAVADRRGFTEAGRSLGLSQQVVSKKVRALESLVGVPLFVRSTRSVSLSAAGRVLYAECETGYQALRHALARAKAAGSAQAGVIRVTAPQVVNARLLAASAARFRIAHPAIQLELSSNDRLVDLTREGFDFAVTLGRVRDGDYVARRLLDVQLGVYAAPGLLRKHRVSREVQGLSELPGVHFRARDATGPWRWQLFKGSHRVEVEPALALLTDDPEVELQAACAGAGIALLPEFVAQQAVEAGQLERLHPEWASERYTLFARYVARRHLSPASRLLLLHWSTDLQPA